MAERLVEDENIDLERLRTIWRIAGSAWGSSMNQAVEGWRFDNLGTSDEMLAKFGGTWRPTPSIGDDAEGYYHQAWMFGQFNREDIWEHFAKAGQLRLEARVGPVIYLTDGDPRKCESAAGMYSGTSSAAKNYAAAIIVPEYPLGGAAEPGVRRGLIYEAAFSFPPKTGVPQLPLPVPPEAWDEDFDSETEWPIGEREASGAVGRLSPVHALGAINFAEGFFRGWRFDDERSEENWKFWNANYFNDIFSGPNFVTPQGAESPLGPRSLIDWWLMWNFVEDKPTASEMVNELRARAAEGEFEGLSFIAKSKCQLRVIYLKGDGSDDPPEPSIANTVVGDPITFTREQTFTLGSFNDQVDEGGDFWFDIDHEPIRDFNYLDDPKVEKTDGDAFELGMPAGCHGVAGVIYSIWDEDRWMSAAVDSSRTLIDPRSRYGGLAPHELRFNFGVGGEGKPITVPGGAIAGTGAAAGSKPHHRPTRGNVA